MIINNRQLHLSQVCADLHIQPSLYNEKACALGHSLIRGIAFSIDPTVYHVPFTAGSTERCRVILHENPYGRAHALTACSCEDWRLHHRNDLMSSLWICPHGASVLLSLGRSDTYLDFISLPKAPPVVPAVEMDFGLNRRGFFAAFGKKYLYRWGVLGIDLEMAKKSYRLRFGVNSLSELKQRDWAIAATDILSAVQSDEAMTRKAAEIKATLLGAKEAA